MRSVRLVAPILLFISALALAQPPRMPQAQQPPQVVPPANFAPPVFFASNGLQSDAIAVADLNGDGKLDLVVGSPDSVSVLLGNGDGTFQPAVTYPGGAVANSLAVLDMNGDGHLDRVAGNSSTVNVFLGNGNGTFQPAVVTNMGGYALAVADVNHDSIPDAVLTVSSGIAVLLGNGDGTFKAPVLTATVGSTSLAVADLDRDGKPDAVIVTYPGLITNKQRVRATVGLLRGNGDGTFQQPLNYDTGGYFPIQIAISDVDLNGWPDILVVNYLGTMNRIAGSVGVLLNGSQDSFFLEMVSPGGHSAWAVAEGDLNGDGVPDLVIVIDGNLVVDLAGGEVRNRGIYSGPKAVAIADVNGDGQPDLVAATSCLTPTDCSTGAAAVLLSTALPSTTTVTSSANPSQAGQAVTFTATITSGRGAPPDGVTVTFFDGSTKLGTALTTNGAATFTTSTLKAGTDLIKAKFPGCTFFKKSQGMINQVVNP
jgi:hypothetical protein